MATIFVRHTVSNYAAWRKVYDDFAPVQKAKGVTAQAVYRSRRFTDEANLFPLAASWDGQLDLYWETADKRWSVEAYGQNLAKKDFSDVFGIVVSYRF